jgi:hypothetical protein
VRDWSVNVVLVVGDQIGWSIEAPQLWQLMSSVVLILAIVWCSPQFGHCETSS